MATWFKQARAEIRMVESTLGLEHGPERREALSYLEGANEMDPDAFPDSYVRELWEELRSTWVEEVREMRRK
eukprot:2909683-Lingulodinium_polyedra.AAC.1